VVRAADAKEVGVGNPAEETCRSPNLPQLICVRPNVNRVYWRPNNSSLDRRQCLDAPEGCDCIPPGMKLFLSAITATIALAAFTGCYRTQEGRLHGGVPFSKDTIESRYERTADQLFRAARDTLAFNGTLTSDNTVSKILTAKIDTRTVWVKVEQAEPTISRIVVQARKSTGAGDIDLASEVDKQTALRLKVMPIN